MIFIPTLIPELFSAASIALLVTEKRRNANHAIRFWDTIEGVAVRDYVDPSVAGTAYGVLGVANGVGDFISSIMVGFIWVAFSPGPAFIIPAIVGAVLMASAPAGTHKA